MEYKEIMDRVLGMLKRADGNDPSEGHLTMDRWEWPTGVALYGIDTSMNAIGVVETGGFNVEL